MSDRVAASEDRRRFRELLDRSSLGPIAEHREPFSAPPAVLCLASPFSTVKHGSEYQLTVGDCDGQIVYACREHLADALDDLHENYGVDVVVRRWP